MTQPCLGVPLELSHHVLPEPVDDALAGERNERDLARLPRLKAHRGAGGDIEPHAARLFAIEFERRIGLEEMIMRADLDRPIAGVGNRQCHGLATGIELDLTLLDEHFTGNHEAPPRPRVHLIGSRTVTSLVPSGKVASTWMSWIISAMPSMTSLRVSTCAPASINSATVLPSRAPSTMKSVMSATASGRLSLTPRSRRRRATIAAMAMSSLSFSRGVRFMTSPSLVFTLSSATAAATARREPRQARRGDHVGAPPRPARKDARPSAHSRRRRQPRRATDRRARARRPQSLRRRAPPIRLRRRCPPWQPRA